MEDDRKAERGAGGPIGRGARALGVLLVAGACATTPIYKEGGRANVANPYTFTILFQGGCPVKATGDVRNCPGGEDDCIRMKAGQSVRFASNPPNNDFVLRFDPFGRTSLESVGGLVDAIGEKHEKPGKPYTFTVRSKGPGCPVVDPQIILD